VIFSGGTLPEMTGAPTLGMHNQEIFSALLGLDESQLASLKDSGVI